MSLPDHIRDAIEKLPVSIPDGWCTTEKATVLAQLALDSKPQIIVEIGTYSGRSLIPMALALKENGTGRIFGIDPWQNTDAIRLETEEINRDWWAKIDLTKILNICTLGIHEFGVERQCVLIRAISQDVEGLFGKIDLLHIDGCHSRAASTSDVDIYFPKVRKGGDVVLDDTDWKSLQFATEKVAKASDLVKDGGGYRIYRKR